MSATVDSAQSAQHGNKTAVAIWALLLVASFCTSGVIFGWPSLVLILNDEGVFEDLCGGGARDCDARQARLSQIFSGSFFCLLAGRLAWGLLLDCVGPRVTSVSSTITILLGAAFVAGAFGGAISMDFFLLGFALIGLGGPGVHLATFHVSNLFPSMKRTVTASISGVFGTSGLALLLLRIAYVAGASAMQVFVAYLIVLCGVAVTYFLVQPDANFKVGDAVTCERCRVALKPSCATQGQVSPQSNAGMSIARSLLDWRMIGLGIFFSVGFLNLQFYLGQAELMLNKLGDRDLGSPYLLLFNVIGSSALLLFYPVGKLLDRLSWDAIFFVALGLSVVYNAVSLVDSLPLQAVGFVCWCISRLILFAGFFSFIPAVVGFRRFGLVSGVLSLGSSLVGLLNLPLAAATLDAGSHKPVIVGFLAASCILAVFPFALLRSRLRTASATKAALDATVAADAKPEGCKGATTEESGTSSV